MDAVLEPPFPSTVIKALTPIIGIVEARNGFLSSDQPCSQGYDRDLPLHPDEDEDPFQDNIYKVCLSIVGLVWIWTLTVVISDIYLMK